MGTNPNYYANDKDKALAVKMAAVGISNKQIAAVIGISDDTLVKNYGEQIRAAKAESNALVAGKLFQKAMEGDTTCMIFWLKTQAQWQEVMKIEQKIEAEVKYKISAKPMTPEEWLAEYTRTDSLGTTTGATNGIDYMPTE